MYDQRVDRAVGAHKRFGVRTFGSLQEGLAWKPSVLIVSTPPGAKREYINLAFERGLHLFTEADIWTYGAALRSDSREGVISTSSASLKFLPLVRGLADLVRQHVGSVLNYQHVLGTFMPRWHPEEGNEYYGRQRETAPAREMVCFELHFLNSVFGPAVEVAGHFDKIGNLPGEAEDTWSVMLRLEKGGIGQLISTMACPADYRRGCCLGTAGMATWDLNSGEVSFATSADPTVRKHQFGAMSAVLDAAYFEEINTFVNAVLGRTPWLDSYALSQESTAILAAAEKSWGTGRWIEVDPQAEPKRSSLSRPR